MVIRPGAIPKRKFSSFELFQKNKDGFVLFCPFLKTDYRLKIKGRRP